MSENPLELGAASIFAALFILTSLLSTWVKTEFGPAGIYSLAAVVGITDIDPFDARALSCASSQARSTDLVLRFIIKFY